MTAPPGWLARRCVSWVEGYRRLGNGRLRVCRFEPSCSTYALEAFRTRRFVPALASISWRIVRCNPLVRKGSRDPVRPTTRRRPNALATAMILLSIFGISILVWSSVAYAQVVSGGCTASINDVPPQRMTHENPLVVREGDQVTVRGAVPPQVATASDIQSVTTIEIQGIVGISGYKSEAHRGEGPTWGGTVDVDAYLEWGTGIYLVRANASGTPGGWSCVADGYVELEGNALAKPVGQIAAGVTLAGTVGAVAATRPTRQSKAALLSRASAAPATPPGPAPPTADADVATRPDRTDPVDGVIGMTDDMNTPKSLTNAEWNLGCALAVLLAAIVFLFGGPLAGSAAAAVPRSRRTIWAHGHAVLGAISGLFAGLGVAVLGQQVGLYPLTVASGIVFPIVTAIACGVRAYMGRPYGGRPTTPGSRPAAPPTAPPRPA